MHCIVSSSKVLYMSFIDVYSSFWDLKDGLVGGGGAGARPEML